MKNRARTEARKSSDSERYADMLNGIAYNHEGPAMPNGPCHCAECGRMIEIPPEHMETELALQREFDQLMLSCDVLAQQPITPLVIIESMILKAQMDDHGDRLREHIEAITRNKG